MFSKLMFWEYVPLTKIYIRTENEYYPRRINVIFIILKMSHRKLMIKIKINIY